MPKKKFELSSKHRALIDIVSNTPSLEYILLFDNKRIPSDYRDLAERQLIDALRIICKDTQLQDICDDLISRAEDIFNHY